MSKTSDNFMIHGISQITADYWYSSLGKIASVIQIFTEIYVHVTPNRLIKLPKQEIYYKHPGNAALKRFIQPS